MARFKQLFFLLMLTFFNFSFSQDIPNSKDLLVGTLPNGLTYYIYKNEKPENKASLNLVVAAGSLYETDPQQGLAHFLEHMAFNGTTKYEKNELVKYLQSIGLSFGGDLNAHTSFSETVYKLQISAKDEKDIDEGVEVLREWASEITLNEEDVEKEKDIILEEWRLRQGLAQRLGDTKKKAVFGGSRYFERFPIGLPETIKGATPKLLQEYYHKWYNPQNMAVIAVGDFDPAVVENIIKKYFSYEPSVKFVKGEDYSLGKVENKAVVFTDPEIPYISFEFTTRKDHKAVTNTETFKESVIDLLLTGMLNTRLSTLSKKKDSPIIQGYFYSYDLDKNDDIVTMAGVLKEDKVNAGIEVLLRELKKMAAKGPSPAELSLEKEQVLKDLENLKNNRNSITHETFIEELRDVYLYGESFIEPGDAIELFNKVADSITQEDIKDRAEMIYKQDGVYFLTAPESIKSKLPNEADILKAADSIKTEPVEDLEQDDTVLVLKPLDINPGKIVKTENLKDYDKFILSNGIEVFYKETDFDKDKISIQIFKEEGSSDNTQKEYLNLLLASSIISNSTVGNIKGEELELFMKGKNFSVSPYVSDYEQGLNIISNKKDLETALEYASYLLREPKVDEDIFASVIEQNREIIKNRDNSPRTVYRDKLKAVLSQNHPRRAPLTLDDLEMISPEEILKVFKEKFSNFNGFKVVIVGSIDKIQTENIIKKYFASLPVSSEKKGVKELGITAPKGTTEEKVVKGTDKKATVSLIYPYEDTYSNENRVLYYALSKILNIVLIDDIREKMGGVYSIGSAADLAPENHGENQLLIRFSTDVNKVNELTAAVRKIIDEIAAGDIDNKILESVIKNYAFNYETMLKTNDYWKQVIYKQNVENSQFRTYTPDEYAALVTKENMVKFIKRAVDQSNYIEVVLIPEKVE